MFVDMLYTDLGWPLYSGVFTLFYISLFCKLHSLYSDPLLVTGNFL